MRSRVLLECIQSAGASLLTKGKVSCLRKHRCHATKYRLSHGKLASRKISLLEKGEGAAKITLGALVTREGERPWVLTLGVASVPRAGAGDLDPTAV